MSAPTTTHRPSPPSEPSAPESTPSSSSRSHTRRSLLAGALGGLGALAAEAIAHVNPVRATNGDTVTVGGSFTGTSPTTITSTTGDAIHAIDTATSASGLFAWASASTGGTYGVYSRSDSSSGTGVYGSADATSGTTIGVDGEAASPAGTGVYGHASATSGQSMGVHGLADSSSGVGVKGENATYIGVFGVSTSGTAVYGDAVSGVGVAGGSQSYIGVDGQNAATDQPAVRAYSAGNSTGLLGSSGNPDVTPPAKTGVYGYANQDASSKGVLGFSGHGHGVHGQAHAGIGLFGKASHTGHALRTYGRIKADKVSGVASIAAGSTSVTIKPGVDITSGSFVLLTPKANIGSRGLWFSTNPSGGTISIHLSSSRSSATPIAWLMLG